MTLDEIGQRIDGIIHRFNRPFSTDPQDLPSRIAVLSFDLGVIRGEIRNATREGSTADKAEPYEGGAVQEF